MKHYAILSQGDENISQNLESECQVCFKECSSPGRVVDPCPRYGGKRRHGKIRNNKGTVFLCCDETKTTKLFRGKLEALSYAYHDLLIPKKQYENEARLVEQQRVNRLIHNLTSINAHNIQEIYELIPQEILAANYPEQLTHIQKEISKDVKKAALMFIRIAKHNIHMKSEFSIYKKLDRNDAVLDRRFHAIKKVILNVLHTFFADFTNLSIYVNIEDYNGKVYMDYESIQVALYHLIENMSKYTMPYSEINIKFIQEDGKTNVLFAMQSLQIIEDEIDRIFQEGYSGKLARESKLNGDGIGLWQIRQMMKLNEGAIKVINGPKKLTLNGRTYADNVFILTFPNRSE